MIGENHRAERLNQMTTAWQYGMKTNLDFLENLLPESRGIVFLCSRQTEGQDRGQLSAGYSYYPNPVRNAVQDSEGQCTIAATSLLVTFC